MKDVTIVPANQTDVDAVFSVIVDCAKDLATQGYENWLRYDRKKVESLFSSGAVFVLKKQENIIGCIKISEQAPFFFTDQDRELYTQTKHPYYFTAFAIHPDSQKHGYGSLLLDFVEKYVIQQGGEYLRMTMFSKNKALQQYYLQKGFNKVQQRLIPEIELELWFGEKKV